MKEDSRLWQQLEETDRKREKGLCRISFSNLDELELFASVKCLDEYMQETLIHKAEGKDFQEWYLGQWRCFCRHSFQRPRIYNFLFFSPEGTQNLNEVFRSSNAPKIC